MPMPDPTGDPGMEPQFFASSKTGAAALVIAVIALVIAIIALIVANSARQNRDSGDVKKAANYRQASSEELIANMERRPTVKDASSYHLTLRRVTT